MLTFDLLQLHSLFNIICLKSTYVEIKVRPVFLSEYEKQKSAPWQGLAPCILIYQTSPLFTKITQIYASPWMKRWFLANFGFKLSKFKRNPWQLTNKWLAPKIYWLFEKCPKLFFLEQRKFFLFPTTILNLWHFVHKLFVVNFLSFVSLLA